VSKKIIWGEAPVWMLVALLVPAVALAADKKNDAAAKAAAQAAENYDAQFAKYLEAARAGATAPTPGSQWMSGLLGDLRAHNVNDLVTVRVIETITAQGSADSSLDKKSNAAVAVPNVFGLESKYPGALDPASLAALSASTSFKGSGNTSRSGSLSANLTARVTEVLPNGDMVLEGVRQIEINGDRQIVVLSGVVRSADVGPGNVVPSTAVGQMRIKYFGQGLIKDNLQPGFLVKFLNKIF
jgi:flagellar L-ring protein precursor FlgH